jgi:hypothetical protein
MLIFFRKHYSHLGALVTLPVKLAIYGMASMAFLSMILGKARKSMGFRQKQCEGETLYVFHSSAEGLERCRQFARRKGLAARFELVTSVAEIEVPQVTGRQQEVDTHGETYEVFDTSMFRFEDILRIMASKASQGVSLATFYPERPMLITQQDVIC